MDDRATDWWNQPAVKLSVQRPERPSWMSSVTVVLHRTADQGDTLPAGSLACACTQTRLPGTSGSVACVVPCACSDHAPVRYADIAVPPAVPVLTRSRTLRSPAAPSVAATANTISSIVAGAYWNSGGAGIDTRGAVVSSGLVHRLLACWFHALPVRTGRVGPRGERVVDDPLSSPVAPVRSAP